VIDGHTREALATVPRTSLRAYRVVEVLDRLAAERGRPRTLQGGTSAAELPAPRVRRQGARPMAHLNGVGIDFARPGRPTDDGLLEAFNARLRAECPNTSWFRSMTDARDRIEGWGCAYHEDRPPSALGT
jgi:putative transposase